MKDLWIKNSSFSGDTKYIFEKNNTYGIVKAIVSNDLGEITLVYNTGRTFNSNINTRKLELHEIITYRLTGVLKQEDIE